MLDRPCPIQGKTAGYPLHSPFSPSLLHPCVSVCHQIPFLLYPFYRRLGGFQGRSRRVRKISSLPGFDPRTLQPVVSRYTDWATRPTRIEKYNGKFIIVHIILNIISSLRSLYWISCCLHADQILQNLPAPYKRLSRPDLQDITTPRRQVYWPLLATVTPPSQAVQAHCKHGIMWTWKTFQVLKVVLRNANLLGR